MTLTNVRLWTVDQYHCMLATGILDSNDRVELLEGQIVPISPQQPPHASTSQRTARYLDRLLDGIAYIRTQLPITLRPKSEPEPDIAVVRIDPREYSDRHPGPDDIFLIIEISDRTLLKDRKQKAKAYASAGIVDYWILDVDKRQARIYRNPGKNGYNSERILTPDDSLIPLAFPTLDIPLSQLFLP